MLASAPPSLARADQLANLVHLMEAFGRNLVAACHALDICLH